MDPKKTFLIIFAKEEADHFNRCTFPILGRPVVVYPILAALNTNEVDKVFISTGSKRIIEQTKTFKGIELLRREYECPTIWDEIKRSVSESIKKSGEQPDYIVVLLGNSPCVLSENIDNAVNTITKNEEIDSVVSAIERHEFAASNAYSINGKGLLNPFSENDESSEYNIFIDARIIILRTRNILSGTAVSLNGFLGEKIKPIFQDQGLSDIDYTWQVPIAEQWLKKYGFSETKTPYKDKEAKMELLAVDETKNNQNTFRVFVSSVPFGTVDSYPIKLLEEEKNCVYSINPLGRKFKEEDSCKFIKNVDVLIAGTEPITENVLKNANKLKLISRVGIGLDGIDLNAARQRGIKVSYTPDGPSAAVAELTIGQMLNMNRRLGHSDNALKDGVWQRYMGDRIANQTIGIIGTGRIGSRVLKLLQGFSPKRILVNDINPNRHLYDLHNAEDVSKETIYRDSDIISLHIPLTPDTSGLIGIKEMKKMKDNVYLINTSRGGIIHEEDLYNALKNNIIGGASIDTFENEPYGGKLITLENSFLTCHIGSCSKDCHFQMEKLATEEALRYIRGEKLELTVPEHEYQLQKTN